MIHQNEKSQSLRSQYGQPTLRLDKLIPTYALEDKLGRTHVSTPDTEVLAMVNEGIAEARAKGDTRWAHPMFVKQTHKAALWIHNEHRLEYRWVMGSH